MFDALPVSSFVVDLIKQQQDYGADANNENGMMFKIFYKYKFFWGSISN